MGRWVDIDDERNCYIGMEGEYEQYNIDPDVLSEGIDIKIGKWIEVTGYASPGGDPVWCCSECGKGIHAYGVEHGSYGANISDGQWKACPNCGCLITNNKGVI